MKNYIKRFFNNEILSYLFFGVATTVVAVLTRMLCYAVTSNELLSTAIGNIAGILFLLRQMTQLFLSNKEGAGALVLSNLLLRDFPLFCWTWGSHSFLLQHFLALLVNLSTMISKRLIPLKLYLLKSLLLCSIIFLVKSLYLKINQLIKKTNLPQMVVCLQSKRALRLFFLKYLHLDCQLLDE